MGLDLTALPTYYVPLVAKALNEHHHDEGLITDLTHVRQHYDDMCKYHIQAEGRKRCAVVVSTIDGVIAALKASPK